ECGSSCGPLRNRHRAMTMPATRPWLPEDSVMTGVSRGGRQRGDRDDGSIRQRGENALEDDIEVADTVDRDQLADGGKMIGDRRRLFGVNAQPRSHGLRGIVDATFGLGTAGDALDDQFVGHLELDGDIQRLVETIEQGFERRALGEVARISIEDETLARIRLGNALFQHAEYDLVGYE